MTIGTRLFTALHGELIGTDEFGNKYYTERKGPAGRKPRRWVLYDGRAEASKVPAEWHAWLHYMSDEPLPQLKRAWKKPHAANLTGTSAAYLPQGHELRGGQRAKATGDYQAWQP